MDEPKSQQRCRLCCAGLSRVSCGPDLLAEPAAHLRGIVRRHLRISISPEDRLPRMICVSCASKLEGIHEFATMALKSQEKLKQELVRISTDSAVTVDSSDSSDSTSNKLGDRGLLHSILTKGSTEASNDGESMQGRQRAPSTEEMEVKVDPMLFLQCALEQPSPENNSDLSDDSDSDSDLSTNPQPLTKNSRRRKEKEHKMNKAKEKIDHDDDFREFNNIDESKDNETDVDEYFEESEDLPDDKLKSHICKICARAFFTQIALQNHLWSHLPATANEIHSCDDKPSIPDAQDVFESINGVMSQNMTENNILGGNYICPICGKKISTKGNLKVHLETHRPKGKYGCDICGRIFKTQSNLFRHKEYHSGIQFPCSVCGRVYPTNSTLRAHSITHSDLRPHACPLCDKTFKRNQDLKFHINQHTGARPYQCPYCPKAFASSGNCFSHRKRMHPKEVHRDRQRAADLMR